MGSMGRVGNALDNALAESYFVSLQTELLDRKIRPTRSSLKAATLEHIEIPYNRTRRYSRLEHFSSPEFEGRVASFKSQQLD